jgi:phosphoenolpyruvate-protein phosphotransferase/dihydroxyacetone kinase phosphotransfer subunit
MVGIVIVSHSAKLAAGIQELAQQIGGISLAIAAGIDDPENPLGTDVMQVYQAIESVYSDEGVVVLMDLGSAVLSAQMALDFFTEEKREKVRLCEAPLVEGTIAAAVQVSAGANLEQVLREARESLAAKAAFLSGENQPSLIEFTPLQPTGEIHLVVHNKMGMHARPAAKFVTTASKFQSKITLQNVSANSKLVNGKSINQVVTSAIRQGDEIAIAATGVDATEALAALQQLVEDNFGENFHTTPFIETPQVCNAQLSGISASPGIAIGNVVIYQPTIFGIANQQADNFHVEWEKFQTAVKSSRQQIQMLRQKAASRGKEEAAIFDAHLLFLEDPAVIDRVRLLIFEESKSAEAAWQIVVNDTLSLYQALKDSYLQARAIDVSDVGNQVLQLLTGKQVETLDLQEPGILVADELTPSETVQLDPSKVLGICTVSGGANSHTGILARSLGIPAVMGVGVNLLQLENGTLIALDGGSGEVWVEPDEIQLRELRRQRDHQLAENEALKTAAQQPAFTSDGRRVKVMANICGVADAKFAVDSGACGVGLLRSEFLYLDREIAPTEEEQVEIYQTIAKKFFPHPVIIRTLDIGGDKPLPYLNLQPEANPFLGLRGIRFLLDCPNLLKTQLRAILRASYRQQIKVMFPLVASIKEIKAVKDILSTVQAELRYEKISFDEEMEVGMMIEVPAAVMMADKLAKEVDFFSIGTNDLTQYVMASDRNNPKVANLADAFEPAVLRMIQQTVIAAHNAGIWVGVCGELASSGLAIPILVGLGVDELSMNAPAIPAVKATISQLTMKEAEAIASHVLQLDCAQEVREYVAQHLQGEVY